MSDNEPPVVQEGDWQMRQQHGSLLLRYVGPGDACMARPPSPELVHRLYRQLKPRRWPRRKAGRR